MASTSAACSQSEAERNIVREVVKSIMILDHSKKPFKYSDIVSNLNPKPGRNKSAQIIDEAKESLKAMGLILHETKDTNQKMYFITSQTQPLEMMYKHAPEEEVSDRVLLTFILAFIFMKNGTVHSDKLFGHLQELGIYNDSKPLHPYFGNVKKKVLTEFADKLYLSLVKVSADPDLFEIKWGQRAEIEMTKRAILEFICKHGFGGKVKPQDYNSHYEQVLMQEEGRTTKDAAAAEVVEVEVGPANGDNGVQEVAP